MGIFDFRKQNNTKNQSKIIPYNVNSWIYRSFNGDVVSADIVRSCIDALSRNNAKMRLELVRETPEGIKTIDNTSDVARVLAKPNEYMSSYDFIYKVSSMYYISNNVFIYPEYNDKGELISLFPIFYRNFSLEKSKSGRLYAKFSIKYTKTYVVPYDNLIHLRNHFMTDDFFGETNNAVAPSIELVNAQNQGIINGIKNSAIIRGILKATGVIKEEDLVKQRDKFVKDNFSVSNSGGVIVIDNKYDYKQLDSSPYVVDSLTMGEGKKKIYDYFGVNEKFIQSTFTPEEYEAIYEGRLEPFAIMLTQALTNSLFTDRERGFGNKIEANMSKLKYQPMSAITSVIQATNQLGLFTRDEYREMLGYSPLGKEKGGDEIMIAINNYQQVGEENQNEE